MEEKKVMIKGYETIIKNHIEKITNLLDLGFELEDRKEDLLDLSTEIKRFVEYIESEDK